MVGLGLVAAVTVVGDTVVSSFGAALDRSVKADFIIQGTQSGLTPELAAAARPARAGCRVGDPLR